MNKHISLLASLILAAVGVISCSQMPKQEIYTKVEKPEYVPGTFEHFVYNTKDYPTTMEIYQNLDMLKKANSKCQIYVCLSQQRARLYMDGQVIADWPVSTGTSGHDTPTGHYSIQEKKKEYASTVYGNIYDANGKMVKYNADINKDPVPEGGTFKGSPMPNWMRLTWDGVGMHTGKVEAGKRLSHGCIRTPGYMARLLFDITACGTRVHIAEAVEPCYPATATVALAEAKAEAKREQDIKEANAARKKQWELDNPRAARKLAERQAKAAAQAKAQAAAQAKPKTAANR